MMCLENQQEKNIRQFFYFMTEQRSMEAHIEENITTFPLLMD